MATYVIGDVQGCYDPLRWLLKHINYNDDQDDLWFTGDLVNRGPKSLEVLRFVKTIPRVICVLGNHDLSLLALAYTDIKLHKHTLNNILEAEDRDSLLTWLRYLPLIHQDSQQNFTLVHAGIPPAWTLLEALQYAAEVETILQGPTFKDLLNSMYGNDPADWQTSLTSWDRYRYIINALTRMRFCNDDGSLDLSYKGTLEQAPQHLKPWYKIPDRKTQGEKILFGHWAALEGKVDVKNVYPLDTGCVWGETLTALRLEDREFFSVSCNKKMGSGP